MEKNDFNPKRKAGKLNDRKVELALFLILGFLLGVMLKTEAVKKITIGFNDYLVTAVENEIDINQIQKDAMAEQEAQRKEQEEAMKQSGESAQQDQSGNVDESQNQDCEGDSCIENEQ
ncbi:MAG: Uncharacterized protein Athens071425_63 [Parcubacteria group bacterium Athens0714_25]|nr:MAG: Uncharacterized protein Athens071425_63 [Parcubacteria group bacterium Athens0714_25]